MHDQFPYTRPCCRQLTRQLFRLVGLGTAANPKPNPGSSPLNVFHLVLRLIKHLLKDFGSLIIILWSKKNA